MRAKQLLHTTLKNAVKLIDIRISRAIFDCVEAAISGSHISVTSLGRHLKSAAKTKHCIKRVDRLFSNTTLHENYTFFYRELAKTVVPKQARVSVLVDASRLSDCGTYQFMSASVPQGGRSLPILEQAFLQSDIMSRKALAGFIADLAEILPKDSEVFFVTDAGFQNPWFSLVKERGWHYVGRAVSSVMHMNDSGHWARLDTLEAGATNKPEFIAHTDVSRANPMTHHIVRFKGPKKGRVKKTAKGKKSLASADKKQEKQANKPWILLTSLSEAQMKAVDIVNLYKTRMQIEESFRDLKDDYHGLGFTYNRSTSTDKITVALLIGSLARYMLWALGLAVKEQKLHFSYQANTERKRSVLSVFFIARQYLRNFKDTHGNSNPWRIIKKRELSFCTESL